MSRFRRRGRDEGDAADDADGVAEETSFPDEGEGLEGPRRDGPWDVTEVEDPAAGRVSLGGLWIPGRPGLEVRVEADQNTSAVVAVALVLGPSALQIQPFAAPRSEGIWADVCAEIRAGITQQGGTADEVEGPFGPELRTNVPTRAPDGRSVGQRARFIGVDGPRWFLRGVLTGDAAADDDAAAELLEVFRDVVVVRGPDAMAPREAIPLQLPTALTDDAGNAEQDDGDPLKPFQRGPEITEIH